MIGREYCKERGRILKREWGENIVYDDRERIVYI